MHFAHVGIDVGQALRGDVEKAQGQRRTDPLVQVVGGERDAQFIKVEFELAERVGAVEDHIDAMFLGSGGNRLHRHHQTGAVGDVGQCHQLESRITREGLAVGAQQTVETGGMRMIDLDHFDPAMTCQPAHGAFHRVVFQITDQHLVARLQPIVIADQRLQTVGGVAGEGDALAGHTDQLGHLRLDLHAFALFETLAHMNRVTAIDQFDVALIFLDHRARHAPEVTVFQIDRARLQIVAIGKGPPKSFISGAAGIVGHGLLNLGRD
ncbi:hypothetical protein D3C87_1185930 [compost metagenome]